MDPGTSLTFFAIVTMSSGGIMSTIEANTAAFSSGKLVEFHVEATLSCVMIAIASCYFPKKR